MSKYRLFACHDRVGLVTCSAPAEINIALNAAKLANKEHGKDQVWHWVDHEDSETKRSAIDRHKGGENTIPPLPENLKQEFLKELKY